MESETELPIHFAWLPNQAGRLGNKAGSTNRLEGMYVHVKGSLQSVYAVVGLYMYRIIPSKHPSLRKCPLPTFDDPVTYDLVSLVPKLPRLGACCAQLAPRRGSLWTRL